MYKGARPEIFGMRGIAWVHIDLTGPAPRAEVHGVGHRRPVTRTVPLHVARELAAAGVRTVVRRPVEATPDLAEVR